MSNNIEGPGNFNNTLEKIYRKHSAEIIEYCIDKMSANPLFKNDDIQTLAEDIVHDLMRNWLKNTPKPENWTLYIRAAVDNKIADKIRKRKREKTESLDSLTPDNHPHADLGGKPINKPATVGVNKVEQIAVNDLTTDELLRHKSLTEKQRHALLDHYVLGIHTSLGKPHQVRQTAKEKLRRKIKPTK